MTLTRARELVEDARAEATGHDDVQTRARLSLARVGLQNGEVEEAALHLRRAVDHAEGEAHIHARNALQMLVPTDGGRDA